MKRRDFLNNTTKIFCACAIGVGVPFLKSCTENVVMSSENREELLIDLNLDFYNPLLQNGGSVVTNSNIIDSQGLLLLRSNDIVKAFTNNCTHSGYDLKPFQNGISTCVSGHGGRFNSNGIAISSPANGSLQEYNTQLNENILTIYG
ncbi:Rieske 2Fe-2S domain-containing protein [Candidatus Marinimicrobia bacterium]|jgi:nitrite reductase/ring-hydroxylating ferredoxin subunit|nr:Rieske 2Fe-2S domain-containing protein [Candidatus Neomarinimicrobiota bacterium]|tara:strand:- start:795 stop:1235 length:441 start_codon:yes stop_codon:yes gene_type:complete